MCRHESTLSIMCICLLLTHSYECHLLPHSVASSAGGAVRMQPFVWVFGRSFWAVSVYGANVYVVSCSNAMHACLEWPLMHHAAQQ